MDEQPIELTDDGELAQPIEVEEKPKRKLKRDEPIWKRPVNVPLPLMLGLISLATIALVIITLLSLTVVKYWLEHGITTSGRFYGVPATSTGELSTPTPISNCSLYSPPTGRIAYLALSTDALYLYSPEDGRNCLLATFQPRSPAISPDGTHIAFTRFLTTRTDIFVVNLITGTEQNLTHALEGHANFPSWSADGEQIIFQSTQVSSTYIKVIDVVSKNVMTLGIGGHPLWSPDGTAIAFLTPNTGTLALMNADGSNVRHLSSNSMRESIIAWSPDSTRILISRMEEGRMIPSQYVIIEPFETQPEQEVLMGAGAWYFDWVAPNRLAYLIENTLHTRMFPENDSLTEDTVILENVSHYDWWMPPQ